MIKSEYKYSAITERIIGCAMEVHCILGTGFQELIYHRALTREMKLQGLNFKSEFVMPIYYKNEHIGTRRVDFLIEDVISLEIKALTALEEVHLAQAINYLEAYNLEIGLLINFGAKSLTYRRLINPKFNNYNHFNQLNNTDKQ